MGDDETLFIYTCVIDTKKERLRTSNTQETIMFTELFIQLRKLDFIFIEDITLMLRDKDKSTSRLSQSIYDGHPRLSPPLNRNSL